MVPHINRRARCGKHVAAPVVVDATERVGALHSATIGKHGTALSDVSPLTCLSSYRSQLPLHRYTSVAGTIFVQTPPCSSTVPAPLLPSTGTACRHGQLSKPVRFAFMRPATLAVWEKTDNCAPCAPGTPALLAAPPPRCRPPRERRAPGASTMSSSCSIRHAAATASACPYQCRKQPCVTALQPVVCMPILPCLCPPLCYAAHARHH